ncbi:MAG TPA: response regulator, partial [Cyclobacteriaceae bacterium]|nr:response regulator [Cyclobacteriaceae bacterium]
VKVVQVALQDKNVTLTVARDGRQAIDRLEKGEEFDLILTDLHMPHKNGDDILKLVREDMKKDTPIVMFSSDGEEEVIALALKLGINDFIVKPVTVESFLKKIKKYLK